MEAAVGIKTGIDDERAPMWRNKYHSTRAFVVRYGGGRLESIPAGDWFSDDLFPSMELAAIAAEDWLNSEPEDDSLPLCAFVKWLGAFPVEKS